MATIEQLEREVLRLRQEHDASKHEIEMLMRESKKAVDMALHNYKLDPLGFILEWDPERRTYKKTNLRVTGHHVHVVNKPVDSKDIIDKAITRDKLSDEVWEEIRRLVSSSGDAVMASMEEYLADFRGTVETTEALKTLHGDKNDWAVVKLKDENNIDVYSRYRWDDEMDDETTGHWKFEMTLESSTLTPEQWEAVNGKVVDVSVLGSFDSNAENQYRIGVLPAEMRTSNEHIRVPFANLEDDMIVNGICCFIPAEYVADVIVSRTVKPCVYAMSDVVLTIHTVNSDGSIGGATTGPYMLSQDDNYQDVTLTNNDIATLRDAIIEHGNHGLYVVVESGDVDTTDGSYISYDAEVLYFAVFNGEHPDVMYRWALNSKTGKYESLYPFEVTWQQATEEQKVLFVQPMIKLMTHEDTQAMMNRILNGNSNE